MTQSLQEMKLSGPLSPEQEKLAGNILQVIEKRALQLLDFVENYSAFSKLVPAKISQVQPKDVSAAISAIFPQLIIEIGENNHHFLVDTGQLEQALINVIKNAFEVNNNEGQVIMKWQESIKETVIYIIDLFHFTQRKIMALVSD